MSPALRLHDAVAENGARDFAVAPRAPAWRRDAQLIHARIGASQGAGFGTSARNVAARACAIALYEIRTVDMWMVVGLAGETAGRAGHRVCTAAFRPHALQQGTPVRPNLTIAALFDHVARRVARLAIGAILGAEMRARGCRAAALQLPAGESVVLHAIDRRGQALASRVLPPAILPIDSQGSAGEHSYSK